MKKKFKSIYDCQWSGSLWRWRRELKKHGINRVIFHKHLATFKGNPLLLRALCEPANEQKTNELRAKRTARKLESKPRNIGGMK